MADNQNINSGTPDQKAAQNSVTFEQWLKTQNNLTDDMRQDLINHNADAAVTFTPESFDRYLAELRAQSSNGGNAGTGNQSQPQNTGGAGNTQPPSAEELCNKAITLANGDLSKLSFDEVAQVWNTLNLADDNLAPDIRQEASKAKAKMAEYSEKAMSEVKLEQPWTMDKAPETSSWLAINNAVLAQSNDTAKKTRNEKIAASLGKFYQNFDKENGLDVINSEEFVKKMEANEAAALEIGKDFEPFAKDEQGKLLHPEFETVDKFYNKLEIDNSNKNVDAINKEDYKEYMAELAFNEAILELSMNPDFAGLDKKRQEELLARAYASHMQVGMLSLIAAQMAEKAQKEDQKQHKPEEFQQKAQEAIDAAVKGENNTFKVSNTAALSTLTTRTTAFEHVTKRVAQKTGRPSFWKRIKEFDKKMAQKYPKAYPLLKNFAISASVSLATGGAGLTVLAAYKTYMAVKKSLKNYNEANKEGRYNSYFGYLKDNKKEMIGIVASAAGTILSGSMVAMDGINVSDFGLSGQVYENGLSNTWDMMKQTVGNAFSSPDAAKDVPWTERAASFGKGFVEKVNPVNWNATRWARMGISLGSGLSAGAVDLAASFREKDPEKRKQLRKNAWKSATGAFLGAGIGLTMAGVMGGAAHENSVDGHSGAAEQVPNTNAQNTETQTDAQNINENVVDKVKGWWNNITRNSEGNDTSADGYVEDPENLKFWEERANKFLGEENTQHIYNMVKSGNIELPEGIESKEEYAYKLAMDIQQTPAEINQALGGDWKNSANLTDSIKSWTKEDFAKLNNSVDDFSDRGYHNGEIPQTHHVRTGGNGGHNPEPAPVNKEPQETVLEPVLTNPAPETGLDEPPVAVVTPVEEDVRDETYYQEEKDALKAQGDDKSLKDQINDARKDKDVTIEETIDNYMDNQVANGNLTEQQHEEVGNLVKHELDGRDGAQDGRVDDEEISKRDVSRGMKEVDKTLTAMKENADEVLIAENLQGGFVIDGEHPETYSANTGDPKFYEGISKVAHDLRSGNEPASEVMKRAIENGEITKEQAAVMNERDRELQNKGYSEDRRFRQMEEDFKRMGKYHEAQNYGAENPGTENAAVTTNPNAATAENAHTEDPAKAENEEKSPQGGAEPVKSSAEHMDKIIEGQATVTLADADKLQPGSFHMEEDKLGNMQYIIKDEAGHTIKLTQVDKLPNGSTVGDNWTIEMPKDHPDYLKLHPEENPNLSGADKVVAKMNVGFQSEDTVKTYLRDIHDGKFTETKELPEQTGVENVSGENSYSIGNGYYSFDDQGGMTINNVPADHDAFLEFSKQIPRYVDNQGQHYLKNELCGDNQNDVQMTLQNLAKDETVYKDIQTRITNGENVPETAREFVGEHDKHLKELGVTHNKDGNIVEYTEAMQRTDEMRAQLSKHGKFGTENTSNPNVENTGKDFHGQVLGQMRANQR